VCIVKDMMVVTQINELKFQRLFKLHPFQGEGSHVEHLLARHFLWRMM